MLIFNPVAGKLRRDPDGIIQRSINLLEKSGIRARPLPTPGPNQAGKLARQAVDADVDLVIAFGGDGTINEVANGMIGSRVPLAILPGGTANVLAMELGLGGRVARAVPKLAQSAPERISVGRIRNAFCGERHFLMMAGAGLDAEIVYGIDANLKKRLGKVAYWIGGFSHLTKRIPEFTVSIAKQQQRVGFLLASRVRNYGGDLEIATGANLLGNDFEAVLFEGENPLKYMAYFTAVLLRQLARVPGARIETCRKVELFSPEDRRIHLQVDGEYAGQLPAQLDVVDDALTLLVPADFRERLGLRIMEAFSPAAG